MNSASTTVPTDLTNERLPSGRLLALGLQHVLVMYAGTVAVPLIIGGALKLPKDQLAFLINADLFAAGLATLIQAFGFWKFGIRMPVMMGVTFASVAPMMNRGLAERCVSCFWKTLETGLERILAITNRAVSIERGSERRAYAAPGSSRTQISSRLRYFSA